MPKIEFENIPGTQLWRPLNPAPNEALLFLSTAAARRAKAVPNVSLEETWEGAPIGYYIFLAKLPDDHAKFEQEAGKVLDIAKAPPEHTSFAWLSWNGTNATVIAKVEMQPGAPDPTVKTETTVGIVGFPGIGLAVGTPVRGDKDAEGSLRGFVFTYPPQPAHDGQPASGPPWGNSVRCPMDGDFAGCLRFQALLNAREAGD